MEERQPIDLEEQIRRMKAQANYRREQRQKTGRWILVLIGAVMALAIIAVWGTGFAETAASHPVEPALNRTAQRLARR